MTDSTDNRVVLLTPPGRGAIACLAVEGPDAATILQKHVLRSTATSDSLSTQALDRIHYCRWRSAAGDSAGQEPGEDIILVRRASCRWEVHCHGGPAAARRLVADLEQTGCAAVSWREWIAAQPAAEGQVSRPVRAAALTLLADARTQRTAAILLDQYLGAWDQALSNIRAQLAAGNAETVAAKLESLLSFAPLGRHLIEPWRVALAGPPNVGKSSLINALAGYRRAIVHDQPGTTRDKLTVSVALDGWPVELIDTAGLRASGDPLEMAGVARSEAELAAADAVVVVFDVSAPWDAAHIELASRRRDAIIVHNKSDLLPTTGTANGSALSDRPSCLQTSAATGAALDALIQQIVAHLVPSSPAAGSAVPITSAQVQQLQTALEHVRRREMELALSML